MSTKSNRHRATVIEVYPHTGEAAVRFTSGRIECVVPRGGQTYEVGDTGMVDFVRGIQGFEWVFAKGVHR